MTTTRTAASVRAPGLGAWERGDAGGGGEAPVLDVVVPVYNEEAGLDASVRRPHAYMSRSFPYGFRITIADNARTDGSRVGIVATAMADLRGIARLIRVFGTGALPLAELRVRFGRAPEPSTGARTTAVAEEVEV